MLEKGFKRLGKKSISIDDQATIWKQIPLSFGSSQLVKCTANFYYGKHRVVYNDLKTPATFPLVEF